MKSYLVIGMGRFGRQTEEFLSGDTQAEPIDFSAPSIPYYENLAARLGFAKVVLYMALFVFVVVTVICNHKLITYENLYYLAKDIGAMAAVLKFKVDGIVLTGGGSLVWGIDENDGKARMDNLNGIFGVFAAIPLFMVWINLLENQNIGVKE